LLRIAALPDSILCPRPLSIVPPRFPKGGLGVKVLGTNRRSLDYSAGRGILRGGVLQVDLMEPSRHGGSSTQATQTQVPGGERVAAQAQRRFPHSEDTLVAKIHERPLQAVVCALSVGFLLGIVWRT
jgi:hypothetical protein